MLLKTSLCLDVKTIVFLSGLFLSLSLNEVQANPNTCVTTQSGQVVCGKAQPANNNSGDTQESQQNFRLEENDFRLDLKGCFRIEFSNNTVKCDLVVTNLFSKDRDFFIRHGRSRMLSSGNQFYPIDAKLGSSTVGFDGAVGINLVSNVPIKGSITFKEIPSDVSQMSILDINYGRTCCDDGNKFRFSNINIRKASKKASVPVSVQATNNNRLSKFATLTAQEPQARINVRDQPNLSGNNRHYGVPGDRVTILSSTLTEGYTWYKVMFQGSGAEGWVRGDFVNLKN
jgi:Bacterial SH3 domain